MTGGTVAAVVVDIPLFILNTMLNIVHARDVSRLLSTVMFVFSLFDSIHYYIHTIQFTNSVSNPSLLHKVHKLNA